jgi:hypothetical protein
MLRSRADLLRVGSCHLTVEQSSFALIAAPSRWKRGEVDRTKLGRFGRTRTRLSHRFLSSRLVSSGGHDPRVIVALAAVLPLSYVPRTAPAIHLVGQSLRRLLGCPWVELRGLEPLLIPA